MPAGFDYDRLDDSKHPSDGIPVPDEADQSYSHRYVKRDDGRVVSVITVREADGADGKSQVP